MPIVNLYEPKESPVTTLNVDIHPLSLPGGHVPRLENLRIENGVLTCRLGMSDVISPLPVSGEFRGAWFGRIWGMHQLAVAVRVSSETRIYMTDDFVTWTERTTDSGKFGNSRLTHDGIVSFTVIPDTHVSPLVVNTEKLVACSGDDITIMTITTSGRVFQVEPPSTSGAVNILTIDSMLLNLQGSPTFTVPDPSKFNFTTSGSPPDQVIRLTIDPSITNGSHVSVGIGASIITASPESRQILIGVDTAYTMLWDKLKVEALGETLYDPSLPQTNPPIPIALDASGKMLWVFSLKPRSSDWSMVTSTLKLTWVAPTSEAPSSTVTADIFLIALSYPSPAYADWSIAHTYAVRELGLESPGVVYSDYSTQRLSDYGAPTLNGMRLPRSGVLRAQFSCPIPNPSISQRDKGVSSACLYARPPGSERYAYTDEPAFLCTFSGSSWAYDIGGEYDVDYRPAIGSRLYDAPLMYLPDAYCTSPPPASAVRFINDRLYIGSSTGSTRDLVVSEMKGPLRTRKFTRLMNGEIDADASVVRTLGSEDIVAIVPISSQFIGIDTVFIFTSNGVYVSSGSTSSEVINVSRVSLFGTRSPLSISELNGVVFYVDNEMQVRRLEGGAISTISKGRVSEKLKSVPSARKRFIAGCVWDDKYYLAYTPDGETQNTRVLIWDDESKSWTEDVPPLPIHMMVKDYASRQLWAVAQSGGQITLHKYESTQLDLGTNEIDCVIQFPEMSDGVGKGVHIGRVGITSDSSSGVGTVERLYKPTGSTGLSSIDMSSADPVVVRYDGTQTISGPGNGTTAMITLSVPMAGGNRLYRVIAEVEPRNHAYTRSP